VRQASLVSQSPPNPTIHRLACSDTAKRASRNLPTILPGPLQKAISLLMPVTARGTDQESAEERRRRFFFASRRPKAPSTCQSPFLISTSRVPSRSLRSLSSLKSRSPSWTPHARLCDPARTHHRNRLRSDQNRDHEVAHVLLHGDKGQLVDTDRPERSTREVEAELTAYLVKAALGIDKGQEFSRGYIQNWLAGAQAEKVRFPAVFGAVDKVLKAGRPEPERPEGQGRGAPELTP
jgi:hypothetical protein